MMKKNAIYHRPMFFENFLLYSTYAIAAASLALAIFIFCCSCASQQLAENLSEKSIVGDGFLAISKITVSDPESGDLTPVIKTVIVNGKLQTILKNANLLTYTRNSSASVFNASSVTTTETLTISLPPGGSMSDVLKQAGAVIRTDPAATAGTTTTAGNTAAGTTTSADAESAK